MVDFLKPLEKRLDKAFTKDVPKLSPDSKRSLVDYLPWISLVLGLIALYSAWALWHWAHLVNTLLPALSNHMNFGLWLGLIVLVVEGLFYVAAFPGTRDHKTSGWELLFYALVINVAYGVVMLFTAYGGLFTLFETLIGSAIGFYFLFQVRHNYTD